MKEYKARTGAKFNNTDAQVIGEAIENLKDEKGHILVSRIIINAKSESSELHKHFEWDNIKAAHDHRLQQARELVNHIVEVVIIDGEEAIERSFVSVHVEDQGKVYVTIDDAITNEDYRKQLLSKMINTLENLTNTMRLFQDKL